MPTEISGLKLAASITEDLSQLDSSESKLKIILVGDDPASLRYVRKKEQKAQELGVSFELKRYDESVSLDELIDQINTWQKETGKIGIIVQLPLPKSIDRKAVISAIKPSIDVDGLRFCAEVDSGFRPPVIRAIERVMNETEVDYNDKNIVIIGRGFLVGGPLERFLKGKYPQAQIRALGKSDSDWSEVLKKGDVLIGAAPAPRIITPEMIKDDVIIIDAGSAEEDNAITGNFAKECYEKASYYTSVPGGIGPLTVAMIFENLLRR